jgi:2-oxoglutarate ferredoxin oxidoreductase subunit beta
VVRGEFGELSVADGVADDDPRVVVHDEHRDDASYAFALSRLSAADARYAPMGVFRNVERPVYDSMMADQLAEASAKAAGDGDALQKLLTGSDTWTVGSSVG